MHQARINCNLLADMAQKMDNDSFSNIIAAEFSPEMGNAITNTKNFSRCDSGVQRHTAGVDGCLYFG